MLVFSEKSVSLMNLGDSRIFRLTEGNMRRVSVDHVSSFSFGRKPPLTQNLGIPEDEFVLSPTLRSFPAVVGDKYLVCSDGLTDMVREARIKLLLESGDAEGSASALLNEALDNGGSDNVTLAVLIITAGS